VGVQQRRYDGTLFADKMKRANRRIGGIQPSSPADAPSLPLHGVLKMCFPQSDSTRRTTASHPRCTGDAMTQVTVSRPRTCPKTRVIGQRENVVFLSGAKLWVMHNRTDLRHRPRQRNLIALSDGRVFRTPTKQQSPDQKRWPRPRAAASGEMDITSLIRTPFRNCSAKRSTSRCGLVAVSIT